MHMDLSNTVNIGGDNGLLPDGTKPISTINDVQWDSSEANFTRHASAINHQGEFENYIPQFHSYLPGDNELRSSIISHYYPMINMENI